MDIWDIRNKVFALFGFAELNEPTHKTLMKAHLLFLSRQSGTNSFEHEVRLAKQCHQRYLTAILATDVFPGLDRRDPLATKDEEVIPEKFGPNYIYYEDKEEDDQKVTTVQDIEKEIGVGEIT